MAHFAAAVDVDLGEDFLQGKVEVYSGCRWLYCGGFGLWSGLLGGCFLQQIG